MPKIDEKIYTGRTVRFIFQHPISLVRLFNWLAKEWKVKVFKQNDEIIVLVEENEKNEPRSDH